MGVIILILLVHRINIETTRELLDVGGGKLGGGGIGLINGVIVAYLEFSYFTFESGEVRSGLRQVSLGAGEDGFCLFKMSFEFEVGEGGFGGDR